MKIKYVTGIVLAIGLMGCQRNTENFDATGTFEATEVIVSAEASGKLIHFRADEGVQLTCGEEVGLIDTVQLHLQKMQLLANRKSVDTQRPDIGKQIAATRQQIAKAEQEKSRVERLLQSNAANRKQWDDWNAEIALLNKQLEAQLSTLQKSTASLNEQSASVAIHVAQVEDKLQKSRIISPISGTVLAKYAEAGELASVDKPLFKIADVENMYLRAYITSKQLAEVKLGQQVTLYADFGDGERKTFEGTVTWISDKAEFTPKTILTDDERANQVYAIKIAFRNDGTAKIGMYGEVKF